jgi:hypothetical protein
LTSLFGKIERVMLLPPGRTEVNSMTGQHAAREIVVYRDHGDDWRRIEPVDDYGQKIELSLAQLHLGEYLGAGRESSGIP